ncbi:hypothetical protein ACFLXE_03565 [Chloroflexota bacterium]
MQITGEKIREEIRQKYDAKEVFDTIEEFLEKHSQLGSKKVPAFEQQMTKQMANLADKDAKLSAVVADLQKLKNQFLFFYRLMEVKCVRLVESMIYAINKEDYLLLALCARSLVEHAAFMSYLVREAKTEDIEELYTLYGKSIYSTRYFGQEGLVDVINLLDMVEEHLSANGDYVKEINDLLADFAHPAFSSNVLIVDELPGEDMLGPSVEQKKAAIEKVLNTVGTAVRYLDHKIEGFISVGTTVESTLQKTLESATLPDSLIDKKPASDKKPEHPRGWQPTKEEPKIERGPFGGAVFFDKKGRIWHKH